LAKGFYGKVNETGHKALNEMKLEAVV